MKTNVLLLAALIASVSAIAQTQFRKFKVGVGIAWAAQVDEKANGGGMIYLEPAYRLTDAIVLGARVETYSTNLGSARLDAPSFGTLSVNGQYYFNNYNLRGFVGGGIGVFKLNGFAEDVEAKAHAGFYPRAGFDFGNINMYIDYNFIPSFKKEGKAIKNDYLGIHLGISLGGSRYKTMRRK